jgi:hypothetical protein
MCAVYNEDYHLCVCVCVFVCVCASESVWVAIERACEANGIEHYLGMCMCADGIHTHMYERTHTHTHMQRE